MGGNQSMIAGEGQGVLNSLQKGKEKQGWLNWKPALLRVVESPFICSFPKVAHGPKGCGQKDDDIKMCVFTPVLNHTVCWNQCMFNFENLVEDPSIDFPSSSQEDFSPYTLKEHKEGGAGELQNYKLTKVMDCQETEIKAIFWNTKGQIRNWWREL